MLKRLVGLLVVAAVAACAVPSFAQEQNVAQGHLLRLDTNAKKVVIRTDSGSQMQFEYTDQTEVSGADESVAGLGTQTGTQVSIRYEKQETRLLAVRIDVHPRSQRQS